MFRTRRRRLARILLIPLASALLGGLLSGAPVQTAHAGPTLKVDVLARGLSNPWDLTWVGGLMLFNERGGMVWSKRAGAAARVVSTPLTDMFASGEGGLMGMVADPGAARNKRFYVCYASTARDVRVVRWRLTGDTTAVPDGSKPVVVDGLPLTSGRHSGCRLRFGPDGLLYIGTGDAAVGTNPQDLQSLGGKVLRVGSNGTIPTDNPFYGRGGDARYVWSYGHRNVQGLAFRPGTRELWSAEHGSYRDDEVNLIARGANYGWNPVPSDGKPGYNESVPMTDSDEFPAAVKAKWSSGDPTVATSGLTFLADSSWGRWQGAMAVALLKDQGIKLLYLDPGTNLKDNDEEIAGLGAFGRIRTVQYGPDGALYFTTSNTDPIHGVVKADVVGRIAPTAVPPTVRAGTDISPIAPSAVRTGKDVYAFIRTTGDRVEFKRSTDDGKNWPAGWTDTRLTSTSAPSVASSDPDRGRVDVLTRNSNRTLTYTRLVEGLRQPGQVNLGGVTTNATISSLGNNTLDVFALRTDGYAFRKHYDGHRWSGWQRLSGPQLTSRIGASAERSTGATRITGRGTGGTTYERNLTRTGNGHGWVRVTGKLWSGRALGDRYPGRAPIGMSRTYDGYARWQRGVMTTVLDQPISSDPDVVTRKDGTWLMFARNRSGGLSVYDARPGVYAARDLGGVVR